MGLPRCNDAQLAGWRGPFFCAMTDALGTALAEWKGYPKLRDLMQVQLGFVRVVRAETSDGYLWPAVLEFQTQGGRMCVALPRGQDRSPAAYFQGGQINMDTINIVVAKVAQAFSPGVVLPRIIGR